MKHIHRIGAGMLFIFAVAAMMVIGIGLTALVMTLVASLQSNPTLGAGIVAIIFTVVVAYIIGYVGE